MTSKRLNKLESQRLEPSEEDLHEEATFSLSGVLSLTDSQDDIKKWERSNIGSMTSTGNGRGVKNDFDLSESDYDSDENEDDSVSPPSSISRGNSIVQIRARNIVKFDIIGTRIVTTPKKHVLYLLVVTSTAPNSPSIDSDKATIERRYSDFYKLYKELKRQFPEHLNDITFPPRKIYGNLDSTVIDTRSRLLQQFIQTIYGKRDVRNSDMFKKFFYLHSLQQGCQYICGGQFKHALDCLQNGLHLQQKLDIDSSGEVIATICNIVECHMSLGNYHEVENYGKAALEVMREKMTNVYLLPLLQTLKEASSLLDHSMFDIQDIKERMRKVVNINNIEVEHVASLRELAVKRFNK